MNRSNMSKFLFVLLAAAAATVWCAPSTDRYDGAGFRNVTSYRIKYDRVTPGGVRVADPEHQLDDAAVDHAVDTLEACMAGLPVLTPAQRVEAQCYLAPEPRMAGGLDRTAFGVAVAPDWHISPCSGHQLFPCAVGDAPCDAKGLPRDPTCPCSCRGTIQDSTIIVTPNLKLLKGELLRYVTSCNNVWVDPLHTCATP